MSFGQTQALIEYTAGNEERTLELILSAVCHSLVAWTDNPVQWIAVEQHGRSALQPHLDSLDAHRTVGWLSPAFPLLLTAERKATVQGTLSAVRGALRTCDAASYGLLRYLNAAPGLADRFAAYPQPEISVRLAPDWAELLPTRVQMLDDAFGAPRSPASQRAHLIDVVAALHNDRLRLRWLYSEQMHEHSTIARLAQHCREALQLLLANDAR
ncbi:hypothetical protein HC891_15270 [Candidatus Gracilibacteria bacterium]|nr:hypothetical protein [Candidatus Gracilibacteria bacterium]